MDHKLKFFILVITLHVIAFYNLPCFILLVVPIGLKLAYNFCKNWKYLGKIPGGMTITTRGLLENSSRDFYENLLRLWKRYGRNRFVIWIGFERLVGVSRYADVKAVLNASNDKELAEKYHAMWPWIGVDSIRGNDFPCQTFTDVITSSTLNEFTKEVTFVDHMSRRFGALCKHNMSSGDTVDIQTLSRLMMFDILYVIGTGRNIGEQRTELLTEVERLVSMADQRIYSGWMQSSFIRTILGEERRFKSARRKISEIISAHLKSADSKAVAYSVYDDICKKFLNINPSPLVETFVLLGFDRFSIAFTNMIMELSSNAELQDEICREIRENQRNFMKSEKLHNFLIHQLPMHPIITAVTKTISNGVQLADNFIPSSTKNLLYLESLDSHGKLMENSMAKFDECLTMNLMKIFVGEFIVRFKFQMKSVKDLELGCGMSLRRQDVNVCVRNRY